jgi:hypothetical protein
MFNRKQTGGRGRAKKAVAAMAAALALAAVLASSASAAFEASPSAWYTGAYPGTKLVGTEAATMSNVGSVSIKTTYVGYPVEIKGTGVECVGCVIENSGSSALVKGKLRITGVTFEGLAGCATGSTIETKPLIGTVGGEPLHVTQANLRWTAESGNTWALIEVSGASCPLSGTYKLTGTSMGQFKKCQGSFRQQTGH